jgi:hypothetical protein
MITTRRCACGGTIIETWKAIECLKCKHRWEIDFKVSKSVLSPQDNLLRITRVIDGIPSTDYIPIRKIHRTLDYQI